MANPMQKAVLRRQIIYIALILGLLTLSLFWRGKIPLPSAIADDARVNKLLQARRVQDFSNLPAAASPINNVGDWLSSRTILSQASRDSLDLREVEQGDAEVDASFVRLLLTGSRGFAVMALWQAANDYQKRNEFHKLETTVNAITRLQPNFTKPWLFQSWNIAYNVSVENDRLTDAYYYIARGIELLARGERLNRSSPDMRYTIAFYYQNKFSVSDKVTTLRSLMQMSCIKPQDRNPDLFRDPVTKQMNASQQEEFRRFVRKNPQLCRRLREKLNYTQPQQVVNFLEDNRYVPAYYDKDHPDVPLPASEQFPVLPPRFDEARDEAYSGQETLDDNFDAFLAARAWFAYSTTVVPPPMSEPDGRTEYVTVDRFRYRIPHSPTMILFRQGAMRAQSYLADRLQKEGWFDSDTRWYPDRRADNPGEFWFGTRANGGPGEALASTGSNSLEAWRRAFDMWHLHGERTGLLFDDAKRGRFEELARNVPNDSQIISLTPDQLRDMKISPESVRARNVLRTHKLNRSTTNYAYFLSSSEAEADPLTVKARQKLYDAEQNRLAGKIDAASIRQYCQAQADWRQVLLRYRDFAKSDKPEEDSYEAQLNLVFMMEKTQEIQSRAKTTLAAVQGLVPAAVDEATKFPFSKDLAREIAERECNLRIACYDPQVQLRVDRLIGQPADDAILAKDWPVLLRWKRAVAAELFARDAAKNGKNVTPAEREKAADDLQWRLKAGESLQKASTVPAWPDLANARDEIARQVVEKEFDWLPDYRDNFKDDENRWFRPSSKQSVRVRLNLNRPKASDPTVEIAPVTR
jgi:hypothetical protein